MASLIGKITKATNGDSFFQPSIGTKEIPVKLRISPGKARAPIRKSSELSVPSILRLGRQVYDWLMKTFNAPNGREVCETVTDSGVTGIMDTSIPKKALAAWREQLLRRMAIDAGTRHAEDLAEIERLKEQP